MSEDELSRSGCFFERYLAVPVLISFQEQRYPSPGVKFHLLKSGRIRHLSWLLGPESRCISSVRRTKPRRRSSVGF